MRTSRKLLWLIASLAAGSIIIVILKSMDSNMPVRSGQSQPASSTSEQLTDEELARLAAKQLAALLSRNEIAASAEADRVRLGTRSLSLRTLATKVIQMNGRFVAALDFSCEVDGTPMKSLYSGSIGVDTSRDSALLTAVVEWVAQYGFAIGSALASPRRQGTLAVGGFLVHEGATGVRGQAPPGFSPDKAFHAQVLNHLEPLLRESFSKDPPARLHALTLTLALGGEQAQGECRADGVVAPRLCERALAFAWPQGSDPYMFKQYYVFVPAQLQEE
ncbi:DUF6348 family protein [Myxococcus sp. RHSTA-1-4]|uniref:DUF6348 family protein n=1 Tax=Myxococcus sp. RHSTA-1-4 TaxID=2874601 RepID=UPI001CBA7CAD|nr:DUF6348 family protein [Myxococcus sp. RHSTA-1-4]MBZ4419871.1 DUF6348 family protein [Myxococcus sp. RHSTA-1-4]